jgi:hypothetical protein
MASFPLGNWLKSVATGVYAAIVQGSVANGAAPTANPILVAGSDGTLTRTLKTSETGEVVVDSLPAGTNLIGNVGIDQTTPGTTNGVVLNSTNVEGTPDSAVPSKANFIAGQYSVADPTYDDGDLTPLRTNEKGEVLTQLSGSTVAIPIEVQYSNTRVWATATATMPAATAGEHTAGDVVGAGAILQFDTGLPAGTSGIILSSLVTLNQNAVFSGGAGYYLYLWTIPQTVIADGTAFNLASLTGYVDRISIGTLVDLGDFVVCGDCGHNLDFTLAAADTKLYGMLVCKGTETTIQDKTITINLGIAGL